MSLLLVVLFLQIDEAIKIEQCGLHVCTFECKGRQQQIVTYQLWFQNLTVSLHGGLCWQCTLQKQWLLFCQVHSPPGFVYTQICMCTWAIAIQCCTITIHSSAAYTTITCTSLACLLVICQIVLNKKIKHRLAACQNVNKIVSVTKIKRCNRKDSYISRTFLLKIWAKNRGCGLYTRPLLSERVTGFFVSQIELKTFRIKIKHNETCCWSLPFRWLPKEPFVTISRTLDGSKPESCSPVVLSRVLFVLCLSS